MTINIIFVTSIEIIKFAINLVLNKIFEEIIYLTYRRIDLDVSLLYLK
jgi:hypothetical protein